MTNPNTELIDNVGRIATTDDLKSREELLIELQFMRVSVSRLATDLVSCQDSLKATQAECAQYKVDAELYRWLKPRVLCADFDYGEPSGCVLVFEIDKDMRVSGDLDASIRDAMKAKP